MTEPATSLPEPSDKITRRGLSWIWLVPLFALGTVVWLMVRAERDKGPEIVIRFEQANGLEQGKTEVSFRGVRVGTVTRLEILPDFLSVAAHVRLIRFAAPLAREGTVFWIEQPEFSLTDGVTGLDTLIKGNYIAVQAGSGPPTTEFQGLSHPPVQLEQEDSFPIRIRASRVVESLQGEPIFFRGIHVGEVEERVISPDHEDVILRAEIRNEFKGLLHEGARFWPIPLIKLSAGAGTVDIKVKDPVTLLRGGLEFDYFGSEKGTGPLASDPLFDLYPTQELARCVGQSFEVSFENGQGLLAGKTEIRYRGVPIGLVQQVTPEPGRQSVRAVGRFFEGFDGILRDQTRFWLVRPGINLQGVQGLETLFSGVYLECAPGPGSPRSKFVGLESQPFPVVEGSGNLRIVLKTPHSALPNHAPLLYRGVEVGRIVDKNLSSDGRHALLTVEVAAPYRALVRQNSKFFALSGIDAYFGFMGIKVQAESLETILAGGVAFATPEGAQMGGSISTGHQFELFAKPEAAWLKWSPAIPLEPGK